MNKNKLNILASRNYFSLQKEERSPIIDMVLVIKPNDEMALFCFKKKYKVNLYASGSLSP